MSQKILQFAFFCLFLLKMCWNLQQTVTFHLWAKALPLLNPFSPGILCEIDIKRNNNINKKKKDFLKVHSIWFITALFSVGSFDVGTRQWAYRTRMFTFLAGLEGLIYNIQVYKKILINRTVTSFYISSKYKIFGM